MSIQQWSAHCFGQPFTPDGAWYTGTRKSKCLNGTMQNMWQHCSPGQELTSQCHDGLTCEGLMYRLMHKPLPVRVGTKVALGWFWQTQVM